ncbi:MAG: peptidoglycan bridge formation glycyltransferase FemA/FemB family protein [Clostridium sp.]|uniref:peptidoglycan bridge formation glycyltransferase FemA/FemB family protein n=1 Tax=Clostridium sp. TaxID=1506 RepID=UPI003037C885
MNNKEKYMKFCDDKNIGIFSQYWWLDTVSGKDGWDVILNEKGGSIVAALPFSYSENRHGIDIHQAKLTQKNGVYIEYPSNQKYTSKLSFEKKAMKEIIDELEKRNLNKYTQNFDYTVTNWLPFYWRGYNQTSRYTYVIEDISDFERIYNNIDSSTKNMIRKAEKIVKIKENLDVDSFYEINKMTFERKGMNIPYDKDLIKKIESETKRRECSKSFYAVDEEGNIHAAIYLVWDKTSVYYLLGGINPDYKNSNATSLLLKNAIEFSVSMNLKFDFEGTMNEDIEKFFSSFGGRQVQYFTISKSFKFSIKDTLMFIVSNSTGFKKLLKSILKK